MTISIIIPNFNGSGLLSKNLPKVLEAVRDYKEGSIEIIITDDASSDNSVEVINSFIKSINARNITGRIVQNSEPKKRGFSKNINRGAQVATGDILILLNSDVVPHKGFLGPLLTHFTREKVFAVGCLDESIEGGKIVLRGRGIGHWEKGFLVHERGEIDESSTLWVSGGSGAFRRTIWKKIGGLYEIYNPFYWEDIDLSYRAQKAGYLVLFEPKSRVIHEHSKGTIQTNFKQFSVQKIVYRNQFLFVWINVTDTSLLLGHILRIPYYIITASLDKNIALLYGLFNAFMLLPQAIYLRAKNKNLFIKKDKEIELFN